MSVKSEDMADRQLPAGGFYSKGDPRIKIEQYDADSGEMELVDVPKAMTRTPLMYEAFMAAAKEESAFRPGHTQMFDQRKVKIEVHHHPAPPVAAYAPGTVPYAAYPPTAPEELWRQAFVQGATAQELQATAAVAKEQIRHKTMEGAMVLEGQALVRQLQASQSEAAKLQEQVRRLEQLATQRAQQLLQQQQQYASDAAARAVAQETSMANLAANQQVEMQKLVHGLEQERRENEERHQRERQAADHRRMAELAEQRARMDQMAAQMAAMMQLHLGQSGQMAAGGGPAQGGAPPTGESTPATPERPTEASGSTSAAQEPPRGAGNGGALPPGGGGPPRDIPDDSMGQDEGPGGVQPPRTMTPGGTAQGQRVAGMGYLSGYKAPEAPLYRGVTVEARRAFVRKYELYLQQCHNYGAAMGYAIVARPIGDCMEPNAKHFAATMQLRKPTHTITNSEWMLWFMEAENVTPMFYSELPERIKKTVIMDETILDGVARFDKWVHAYWSFLENNNAQNFTTDYAKHACRALSEGIRPFTVRKVIKNLLKYDEKHMGLDVMVFLDKVKEELIPACRLERAAKQASLVKPPTKLNDKGEEDTSKPTKTVKTLKYQGDGGKPTVEPPKCWGCKGEHTLRECTATSDTDKKAIMKKRRDERAKREAGLRQTNKVLRTERPGDGSCGARIPSVDLPDAIPTLLDSGCDACAVISAGLHDAIRRVSKLDLRPRRPDQAWTLEGFGGAPVPMDLHVVIPTLEVDTPAGTLRLTNVNAWVDTTDKGLNITLGRPIMVAMGYSTEGLLAAVREQGDSVDLSMLSVTVATDSEEVYKTLKTRYAERLSQQKDPDVEDDDEASEVDPDKADALVAVVLAEKLKEAKAKGLRGKPLAKLKHLLHRFRDVFRLAFKKSDQPVKVEPLQVKLKDGAQPRICKNRRYSPDELEFLRSHLDSIVANDLGVRNTRASWASAPRLVRKKDGSYRMTVDTRYPNSQTIPMLWPMPVLEAVMARLQGKGVYFALDWFKGYWQLALHILSQEYFSIMGPDGIVTSNRVQQGQTDAVAYCQATAQEIYGEKYGHGLEAWLDDVLGNATTPEELMDLLEYLLKRCEKYGLKLNPSKCEFYTTSVVWCGKVISADGIGHDPKRLQGLIDLEAPTNAQELQQFVCALNWMRQSLPDYNAMVAPLTRILDVVCTHAGTRKKERLAKHQLADHGWGQAHLLAVGRCKDALARMATLAHPDPDKVFCLYTDASQDHWGAVLTQISPDQRELPLEDQAHEPLAFLSGTFKGASLRWSTIEKEAYAIVASCKRLDYLLHRPGGFEIHTDHRNLKYIFGQDPVADTPRYLADKLARWAVVLSSFNYVIHHVSGDDNVWGDLLSRWGNRATADAAVWSLDGDKQKVKRLVTLPLPILSPLAPDFEWPNLAKIKKAQEEHKDERATLDPQPELDPDDGLYKARGHIWVPDGATDLQLSLMVIAHAGAMGHRGATATKKVLRDKFHWTGMTMDTSEFVANCLQCLSVGGTTVPRPIGEALHAVTPNKLIHCDFLAMPAGYVHVIVDDASRLCQLTWHDGCKATDMIEAMQQWFATFGLVEDWMSDQGPHYKNQVTDELRRIYGSGHHFSPAHCPWSNGTVEVMMRSIRKTCRTMLVELKRPPSDVKALLPVIQHALNHTPSKRNGNVAPITAMTQLEPSNAMNAFLAQDKVQEIPEAKLKAWRANIWAELAKARDQLHRQIAEAADGKRKAERDRRNKKTGVRQVYLTKGDYVLVGRVGNTKPGKLQITWLGPRRIVEVLSDWVFVVEDLRDGSRSTHHASRMKHYAAAAADVTQDLLDHVAYVEGGHLVEELRDCRFNRTTKRWDILVKWMGLDELETSWEPASDIAEDVPALVQAYIKANIKESSNVKKMATALALVSSASTA